MNILQTNNSNNSKINNKLKSSNNKDIINQKSKTIIGNIRA